MAQTEDILLRMHFREMGLRFLDGMNPQPNRAIVVADAICSYDGEIDTTRPIRYEAHYRDYEMVRVHVLDQSDRLMIEAAEALEKVKP